MKNQTNRLYSDLAWLWPIWEDPKEYAPYCEFVTRMIMRHSPHPAHSLLDIGCGGGKNIYNLKGNFRVSGIDISPQMLDIAKKLNPECQFTLTDMRSFDLSETFDAILIDDSIAYMTTESDLRAVFDRSYAHLHPGGIMICGPDETPESFIQNQTTISPSTASGKPDHLDVVFIENYYDPDPNDTKFEGAFIYLIRNRGNLRIEHDLHNLGLFSIEVWRNLLSDVGFEFIETQYIEGEKIYPLFVCLK